MGFWKDIAPLGGSSPVRCYPNYVLPGGAMYVYGDWLGGRVPSYDALMTYEPDGTTPITPATYDGVLADYTDYADITLTGGQVFVTKVIRHDIVTGRQTFVRGSAGVEIQREKFIIVDPEAPLSGDFYYTAYLDNGGVYSSRPCRAVYEVREPAGPHCVPVLISDPLVVPSMQWIDLLSIDPLSYPPRNELKDIIARSAPVALSGVRSTARTTFHFLTRTLDQRHKLLELFMPGRILLYRNPNPGYPENHWYISVGDVTENRVHPDHAQPMRKWDVEVAVVDRPEGILVPASDRIYLDVREFEPDGRTPITPDTYQGVLDDYGDYLTVLLGGRGGGAAIGHGVSPQHLVYGGGRYPTTRSVETSWSLV